MAGSRAAGKLLPDKSRDWPRIALATERVKTQSGFEYLPDKANYRANCSYYQSRGIFCISWSGLVGDLSYWQEEIERFVLEATEVIAFVEVRC